MTALATASRVLAWAAWPVGSPPVGDLDDATALATPRAQARELLQRLTVRTAAVLGAGGQPFGDDGPVGLGALLLAAAVGGRRDSGAAKQIASTAAPLRLTASDMTDRDPAAADPGDDRDPGGEREPGWADAVARHGVVAPVARPGAGLAASDELIESLLAASPLTAVTVRPPREQLRAANGKAPLETVAALLGRPHGNDVLTSALAAPTRDADILAWRTQILTWLARADREALLGVYLAARLRHGAEWDDLLEWAALSFGQSGARVAVLRFWAPLATLDRSDRALLRSQHFLDGYRRALDLAGPYVTATVS